MYVHPPDSYMYDIGGFPANNQWIVPYNLYLLMWYTFSLSLPHMLLIMCF